MVKKATNARRFHETMKRVYGVDDIFSNNPKLDEYFYKKIHKPLYDSLMALNKKPTDTKTLKKALKLYVRLFNFVRDATVVEGKTSKDGIEKYIVRPDEKEFKKRINRAVKALKNYTETSIWGTGIATYIGALAAEHPNPVNTSVASFIGAFSGYNIYKAIRLNRRYSLSIKVRNQTKDEDQLRRLTYMLHGHYMALDRRLRFLARQIEKDKNKNTT